MNQVPADPYIRDSAGRAIGHYSSEPLPGGRGNMRVGQEFTCVWGGQEFSGTVVGFETQGTNPYHRVIIRYRH